MAAKIPYEFSALDEVMPPLFNGLILCFPCRDDSRNELVSALQTGLTNLVKESPFLAGTILRNYSDEADEQGFRPGHLSLSIPDPSNGPKVIINDLTLPDSKWTLTYEELLAQNVPSSKLLPELFAPLIGVGQTNQVLEIRANFITGGLLLTVCASHSVMDAYGMYLVLAGLAKHCRQAQGITGNSKGILPEEISGSVPESIKASIPLSDYQFYKDRPELWRILGLDWRPKEDAPAELPFAGLAKASTKIFNISSKAQVGIKSLATPCTGQDGWVSTNDAIVAFMWSSVMRARYPNGPVAGQKSSSYVSVAINGRKGLEIPPKWGGNVVFCCMTELPLDVLTAKEDASVHGDQSRPLVRIAQTIRQRVEKDKDPNLLNDAVALASCIPDVRRLGNAFYSWLEEDLVTTSLVDLPFYQLDFGPLFAGEKESKKGITDAFRMPAGQFAGICNFQPRLPDGSINVAVSMHQDEMARLERDEQFTQLATFSFE